jgi:protein tyrosine phosphatase (PTP) superfamily phosphohydrolase (DUF442 family)
MKTITILFTIFFLFFQSTAYSMSDSIENIKNFSLLSEKLASSGMPTQPEFELAQQSGYQHIINLIPGDFSDEKVSINALDMSFDQIAVEWSEPTLADFQNFVRLMQTYKQDKVLVHCRLNYRASAFAYLYQTTQLGANESAAHSQMLDIWQPNDTWLEFINEVQEYYKTKNKKRK